MDDVAYVTLCLHQPCYTCALRWAKKNPSCPLCNETIKTDPSNPDHSGVLCPVLGSPVQEGHGTTG
uniref:RING-type domain-containing protein n=1 Tax=Cairina moschata TaxID=8855 RepID=A0A8C3BWB6_CAIMO